MAAKDSLLPIDDDMDGAGSRQEAPTDPPKKRRKKPALRLETTESDGPMPVMAGSTPPRLVVAKLDHDDDDADDDDNDDNDDSTGAPRTTKRARRRPRVEHVSTPPTAAGDTSPEQPSKKRAAKAFM